MACSSAVLFCSSIFLCLSYHVLCFHEAVVRTPALFNKWSMALRYDVIVISYICRDSFQIPVTMWATAAFNMSSFWRVHNSTQKRA